MDIPKKNAVSGTTTNSTVTNIDRSKTTFGELENRTTCPCTDGWSGVSCRAPHLVQKAAPSSICAPQFLQSFIVFPLSDV